MESRHLFVLLALGCSGPDDEGKGTDTDTDSGPVNFEFVPSVRAKSYDATVAADAVAVHKISSTLLAATSVVVSDVKVQDSLFIDGGGASFRASYLDCWTRPQYTRFSFPIDYTSCGSYGMAGGVFIEDHPSGPLLFNFENFTIDAPPAPRTIGGTFALDTRDAFPAAMFWQTYNTDGDNPGPDQDPEVLLGVTLDRTPYGVDYTGGASVDFLNQEWSMWGVMSVIVNVGDPPITVVHGARTAEEISPDQPTGNDVLKSTLGSWTACRCPTRGISSYDMPLNFTSVTVDIDDLEVDPDGTDDPDLVLPVEFDIAGRGVLTHAGCGEYEVEYTSDPLVYSLPADRLVGGLSFLCDTQTIEPVRCSALVRAAQQMPAELQIEVSEADANQTALRAVEQDFDTAWCRLQ